MELEGVRNWEVDTTRPFRSVQEAVSLFGEKVLAGQIVIQTSENGGVQSKVGKVRAELDETKQNLERAKEESVVMATCLSTLEDELHRTKLELQKLKQKEVEKQAMETQIEHLKFIEDPIIDIKASDDDDEGILMEFQKKRYVTFADPPSLTRVMVAPPQGDAYLERHPSLRKKKKKALIPLIGSLFSRKKKTSQDLH